MTAGSPIVLTAAVIAAATGGRITAGPAGTVFEGVSIDSRTVRAGQLFVALRGERFDGTAFVDASLKAGAAGAIVPSGRAPAPAPGCTVIEVTDTLAALQALGHWVRRASGATVVAITGSAGKTTTKEATADLLSERYTVYRNPGNLNNHVGLPLSLVDLRLRPDVAVVELGMNHAGEIRRLVALAEPEIRVWTNVGDAHLGFFASADAIAEAKAEILDGAAASHVLVANADDRRVMAHARRFAGRLVTFGIAEDADVRAVGVEDRGIDGTSARLRARGGEADLTVPLAGRGNLANVLAASAVALELDVPLATVVARAARLRAAARRGQIVPLREGVTLVDDSYNASPSAVRTTLAAVARDTRHRRRVAVLGEMLELGAFAHDLHRAVGLAVAESRVDLLVTVGGEAARALAEGATEGGLATSAVHCVPRSADAADLVTSLVQPGDLVLVKGSRGTRTDIVADRLREAWA